MTPLALSRSLHGVRSLKELMDRAVECIAGSTRYQRAWLLLPMAGTTGLEVVGYALPDKVQVDQRMASLDRKQDRFLARLLGSEETLVIPDLREFPDADQAQVEFFGNRTSINVAMLHVGERVGVFCVGTFAAEGIVEPTPEELRFIEEVAALVSIVAGRLRADEAQRSLEESIQRSQRLASLGQMAGEVAHDFNNMLLAILGNAELALELLDETHGATECVTTIREAALRAANFSRQLLAFSRGQPRERRIVSASEVMQGLAPILRSLLGSRHTLELVDEGAPVPLECDVGQIEQVVLNLVVNARDAMPGGGAITLEVSRSEEDAGSFVVFSITDRGVGMSGDVSARIFEPFFTTKQEGSGTGLGLAVVDSVVKTHGGFVRVDTSLGTGTTIHAAFPAAASPPSAVRKFTSEVTERGARLLVIDDDAEVRRVIVRVLQGAGYEVETASGGADAITLLESGPAFEVVITDLVMPEVGGERVLAWMREHAPDTPVLLLSGYAPGAGAHAFEYVLAKPFASRQLLDKVQDVLTIATLRKVG